MLTIISTRHIYIYIIIIIKIKKLLRLQLEPCTYENKSYFYVSEEHNYHNTRLNFKNIFSFQIEIVHFPTYIQKLNSE